MEKVDQSETLASSAFLENEIALVSSLTRLTLRNCAVRTQIKPVRAKYAFALDKPGI
jgi:hypothetical protein